MRNHYPTANLLRFLDYLFSGKPILSVSTMMAVGFLEELTRNGLLAQDNSPSELSPLSISIGETVLQFGGAQGDDVGSTIIHHAMYIEGGLYLQKGGHSGGLFFSDYKAIEKVFGKNRVIITANKTV